MKILIIDNGTSFLAQLTDMATAQGHNQVEVMKFSHIDLAKTPNYDLIILSGGHSLIVVNHDVEYGNEIKLIKESGKPILGICLGCELIAYSFDSDLELLKHREKSLVELEILESSPLTKALDKAKVHESHRWYIKKLGPNLKALAKSEDGIEIIKHVNLPIYGLQFHPELDPKEGAALLRNLTMSVVPNPDH